jgi:hypothetical protein
MVVVHGACEHPCPRRSSLDLVISGGQAVLSRAFRCSVWHAAGACDDVGECALRAGDGTRGAPPLVAPCDRYPRATGEVGSHSDGDLTPSPSARALTEATKDATCARHRPGPARQVVFGAAGATTFGRGLVSAVAAHAGSDDALRSLLGAAIFGPCWPLPQQGGECGIPTNETCGRCAGPHLSERVFPPSRPNRAHRGHDYCSEELGTHLGVWLGRRPAN